jgi:hypothetical protein
MPNSELVFEIEVLSFKSKYYFIEWLVLRSPRPSSNYSILVCFLELRSSHCTVPHGVQVDGGWSLTSLSCLPVRVCKRR